MNALDYEFIFGELEEARSPRCARMDPASHCMEDVNEFVTAVS